MRVRSPIDSAEIEYTVMGQGPDVVLLHPFPVTHAFWLPIAERLAHRYRLILPDLRGHGASTPGEGPAFMAKHVADLLAVCHDAAVTRAVFAGVSIGGYILFEFWRTERDLVRALILANTRATADTPEARAARLQSAADVLERGPDAFLDGLLPKLLGETTRRNRPDLTARVRGMMPPTAAGIAAVQRGMAERRESVSTLATISVPTLVVGASEDALTPVADARLIHEKVSGSVLQVIGEAGHFALHERHDDGHRIIRSFLDRLPS